MSIINTGLVQKCNGDDSTIVMGTGSSTAGEGAYVADSASTVGGEAVYGRGRRSVFFGARTSMYV